MNKLGIQCQEKHGEVYRYNRELRPIVVKSINILDTAHYTRLARENPGVKLVYRQVPNGPWNSEEDGRKWAEHLHRLVGHIPQITLVEGHNEWIHAPPHNTPDDFDRADRFIAALIDRVHELWGGRVHAVVLNASTGHFAEDIVDFFPLTLARLQECGKCLLGLHEYDHPDSDMLGDGEGWLCGKFLRNLAGLKQAGYDKVRIAITECGVDSGVGAPAGSGHVGFKYWGENAAARYLDDRNLAWYIPLAQETEGVDWLTLYGLGMHGDWETFDIKNTPVIDGIGEIYSGWTPPEPPSDGGEHMIPERVKIYDFDHGPGADDPTVSQQWLESIFGPCINVHPVSEIHTLQPGDLYYQLQWINCKPGTTSVIIELRDENGQPVVGDTVIFRWPSADPHGYANRGWNWSQNGAPGDTDANGIVGPVMSKDAYYSPDQGECGVFSLWIWDYPSEMVDGVGMLPFHDLVPGANHLHTEYGFRLVRWGEEAPPPIPPGPEDGELLDVVKKILATTERIEQILLKETPPEPPTDSPFKGEYFNNVDLSGEPALVRDDENINFSWGDGTPAPEITSDFFSVRWTGKRTFEERTYTFKVLVDDGVRLWLDGNLLIESWKDQPPTPYSISVGVTAGQHDVKVEYYERAGGATCVVWWE